MLAIPRSAANDDDKVANGGEEEGNEREDENFSNFHLLSRSNKNIFETLESSRQKAAAAQSSESSVNERFRRKILMKK